MSAEDKPLPGSKMASHSESLHVDLGCPRQSYGSCKNFGERPEGSRTGLDQGGPVWPTTGPTGSSSDRPWRHELPLQTASGANYARQPMSTWARRRWGTVSVEPGSLHLSLPGAQGTHCPRKQLAGRGLLTIHSGHEVSRTRQSFWTNPDSTWRTQTGEPTSGGSEESGSTLTASSRWCPTVEGPFWCGEASRLTTGPPCTIIRAI